jgi:hypothetical protein
LISIAISIGAFSNEIGEPNSSQDVPSLGKVRKLTIVCKKPNFPGTAFTDTNGSTGAKGLILNLTNLQIITQYQVV